MTVLVVLLLVTALQPLPQNDSVGGSTASDSTAALPQNDSVGGSTASDSTAATATERQCWWFYS